MTDEDKIRREVLEFIENHRVKWADVLRRIAQSIRSDEEPKVVLALVDEIMLDEGLRRVERSLDRHRFLDDALTRPDRSAMELAVTGVDQVYSYRSLTHFNWEPVAQQLETAAEKLAGTVPPSMVTLADGSKTENRLVTRAEAAEILRVRTDAIGRWIRRKKDPLEPSDQLGGDSRSLDRFWLSDIRARQPRESS